MGHKVGIGAIFGIVSEDGVAKANSPVYLYDRSTGKLVSKQFTRNDGGFVFTGLNAEEPTYFVTATDEDGNPPKNALSRDYVQPIPAYSGANYLANWQDVVMRSRPEVVYAGLTDGVKPLSASDTPSLTAGTYQLGATSLTPGASHIPSFQLIQGAVAFPVVPVYQLRGNTGAYYPDPFECSIEFVFDPSSVTSRDLCFALVYNIENVSGLSLRLGSVLLVRYAPTNQKLIVYNRDSSSSSRFTDGLRQLINYTLTTNQPLHVVATVKYAVEAKLYVNGTLVATETAALSGTNGQPYFYSFGSVDNRPTPLALSVSGYGTVDSGSGGSPLERLGVGVVGPAAGWFHRVLTAQEVQEHYNLLFQENTPVLTGYAKEVVLDRPIVYYRLNEADISNGVQNFLTREARVDYDLDRAAAVGAVVNLQPSQSTPVVGGSGVLFDGSCAFLASWAPTAFPNRKEMTFTMLWKPSGTPTADQVIFRIYMRDGSNSDYYYGNLVFVGDVLRNSSDQLVLRLNEGGSTQTYTFTHSFALNQWHWVGITVNKNTGVEEVALWVADGQGAVTKVESLTTSAVNLATGEPNFKRRYASTSLCIGGYVSGGSVSNGFVGGLSEVALFPSALTQSRLQAHFDGMSIP